MAVDKDAIAMFGGKTPKYWIDLDATTRNPGIYGLDANGKPVQHYLYVDPKGDFSINASLNTVVQKYTQDFKAAGTTNAVWTSLFNAGMVSKKEYASKDAAAWFNGLAKYVTSYGVGQVDAIKNGAKAFVPFSTWYKRGDTAVSTGGPTKSTGTTTSTSGYQSTQAEADNEINAFFLDQLGRNATLDERKQYLTALNDEENKVKSTRTTTTTSTSTPGTSASTDKTASTTKTAGPGQLTQADHTRIMTGFLATAIKNTPADQLMKSGGAIANHITDLKDYAADYGLTSYSADTVKNNLASKLKEGALISNTTLDAEKLNIRSLAKGLYPTLSGLIDQGVKVSNVADIYTQQMQKVLEIPYTSINWADDPYISKALQNKGMDGVSQGKEGALNLNDFNVMLRNDARWSKTQNAREEAAGYANSILRSFGLA